MAGDKLAILGAAMELRWCKNTMAEPWFFLTPAHSERFMTPKKTVQVCESPGIAKDDVLPTQILDLINKDPLATLLFGILPIGKVSLLLNFN